MVDVLDEETVDQKSQCLAEATVELVGAGQGPADDSPLFLSC